MTKEEIRNRMIQIMKDLLLGSTPSRTSQMTRLIDPIRQTMNSQMPRHEQWLLHNYVSEIVNEWYRAGILYFGKPDDSNQGYPWFTITDFGKECIESGNFIPYDPDGFINELRQTVPAMDDVTISYVRESIATYNSEHLLSSTITLGAASENIILQLIETFTNAITDPNDKAEFERRINNKGLFVKYREFRERLDSLNNLPRDITQDLDTYLDQTFQFIRINRNQSGHPSGNVVSKRVAYSNLQIFAEYSKKVYELIGYFSNNQI